MHNKQTLTLTGIGMLGAAVLLAGCGGSSFSQSNLANHPNTLPYIYGLEPIAYYGAANVNGVSSVVEGSGFQAASGGQAFITGNTAFTATTPNGATLPGFADPNGTKSLPTAFSTTGQYVDSVNGSGSAVATVTAMPAGTSVIFRAAIANGVSANTASPITSATLTSTDAELASIAGLTAGLPMSLNPVGGAFSNATYAVGAAGAATPFTIPASTTAGLHTVAATVTDGAGRVTSTTFIFPVVTPTTVALFLQNFTVAVPATTSAAATTKASPITGGDTVTIDGGSGSGTYPANYAPTIADPQGTVIFFTAPGTHTVTETDPKGVLVQTSTFTIPVTTGTTTPVPTVGTTIFDIPVTTVAAATTPALRPHILRRH